MTTDREDVMTYEQGVLLSQGCTNMPKTPTVIVLQVFNNIISYPYPYLSLLAFLSW